MGLTVVRAAGLISKLLAGRLVVVGLDATAVIISRCYLMEEVTG